jgi:hypothetical protein
MCCLWSIKALEQGRGSSPSYLWSYTLVARCLVCISQQHHHLHDMFALKVWRCSLWYWAGLWQFWHGLGAAAHMLCKLAYFLSVLCC